MFNIGYFFWSESDERKPFWGNGTDLQMLMGRKDQSWIYRGPSQPTFSLSLESALVQTSVIIKLVGKKERRGKKKALKQRLNFFTAVCSKLSGHTPALSSRVSGHQVQRLSLLDAVLCVSQGLTAGWDVRRPLLAFMIWFTGGWLLLILSPSFVNEE